MVCFVVLLSCKGDGDFVGGGGQSVAGSLSGFSIVEDHLYILSKNQVDVYVIDGNEIQKRSRINTTEELETIYPFQDYIFLGSTTGMLVYNIDDHYHPQHIATVNHIRSCDPVVADSNFAYVTLRSNGTGCWNGSDALYVYRLDDNFTPDLVKEYPMYHPKGLAIKDSLLIVCDDGLKLYDRRKPDSLSLLQHINSFTTSDALVYDNEVLVTTDERLEMFLVNDTSLIFKSAIY